MDEKRRMAQDLVHVGQAVPEVVEATQGGVEAPRKGGNPRYTREQRQAANRRYLAVLDGVVSRAKALDYDAILINTKKHLIQEDVEPTVAEVVAQQEAENFKADMDEMKSQHALLQYLVNNEKG